MAEAAFFENGKLTDVWTQVGRDAGGAPRYRRANYDILLWQPSSAQPAEVYVVPLGMERTNGADVALKSDTSQSVGMEFGYYSGDSLMFDPAEGDGLRDTVQSLHVFGYV